jgi:23S rRNA (cytosine1962-C5)-methyltransferase
MVKVILKHGRDESLRRFHPWVFSGAVAQVQGSPAEGDIVGVFSAEGQFLASGHWQVGSIAVRILSFDADPTAPGFWEDSIARALAVREAVGLVDGENTTCFRLVHGEGDGLPGLIIDWYDGVCVMQAHSVGMFRSKGQICDALKAVFGEHLKAVYDKSSGTAPFKAGLDLIDGYLYRAEGFDAAETVVLENGRKFLVNWEEGQKTGFFLDQRDNRALVGKYAAGRRVLNLFCYTGGFSIYALTAGAALVDSVDSSAKAMSLVARNIQLNSAEAEVNNYCEDAIEFLRKTPEGKYDLLIVDPPAFAKHRGALQNALRAYQRLNAAAIAKVAPGGLVFTFSCSQVVDKITFANTVFSAAAQTGRSVRILDRLCQGSDHPVSIYHPEGEYLKGLLLYVE